MNTYQQHNLSTQSAAGSPHGGTGGPPPGPWNWKGTIAVIIYVGFFLGCVVSCIIELNS